MKKQIPNLNPDIKKKILDIANQFAKEQQEQTSKIIPEKTSENNNETIKIKKGKTKK